MIKLSQPRSQYAVDWENQLVQDEGVYDKSYDCHYSFHNAQGVLFDSSRKSRRMKYRIWEDLEKYIHD